MTMLQRSATPGSLRLPEALTQAERPRLHDSLVRARAAVNTAATDYLHIADADLPKVWLFRGIDPDARVRYAIYRGAETLEAAEAELEAAVTRAPARAPGTIRSAPATIARWALQGRLAAVDDSFLDRVPRDGEWTLRQTLAHTVGGQRGYGAFTRWWLRQPLGDGRPDRIPDSAEAELDHELPPEATEAEGSVAAIRRRFDDVLDEWALRVAGLDEAALAASARWAGVPVDIGFRIGRWASHIREHTIQVDKTLDWLGYSPSESARIVRDLYAAWGRLEARIFPVAPGGTESSVAAILEAMAETLTSGARSAREAAEA